MANTRVEQLSTDECWDLLSRTSVGRIAVSISGHPDIFPINHIVHDHAGEPTIVFRSGAGTKLAAAVLGVGVAYEIDGYEPDRNVAWSVVIKGVAHQIERMDEVYEAQDLPLFPWVVEGPPDFVRIESQEITGRRYHVLDWVEPDHSIGRVSSRSERETEGADSPASVGSADSGSSDRRPYMPPD